MLPTDHIKSLPYFQCKIQHIKGGIPIGSNVSGHYQLWVSVHPVVVACGQQFHYGVEDLESDLHNCGWVGTWTEPGMCLLTLKVPISLGQCCYVIQPSPHLSQGNLIYPALQIIVFFPVILSLCPAQPLSTSLPVLFSGLTPTILSLLHQEPSQHSILVHQIAFVGF